MRICSSCTGALTATTPLPGGDFAGRDRRPVAQTRQARPFLAEAEAWRLVRAYGTRVERILAGATREDIGAVFRRRLTRPRSAI